MSKFSFAILGRRAFLAAVAAVVGFAGAAGSAGAEEWPTEPLTMIIGTKPGGSMDRFGRAMAPFLEKELGQPIKIINKGPSLVGHTMFLQEADGNTIISSTPFPFQVMNVILGHAKFKMSDFSFINAQWVDYPILLVHKDSPYKTAKDLIDDIKNNPGKVKTGVVPNSIGHILTLQLMEELGLNKDAVRVVTYPGGGPKRAAFAGNQFDFGIEAAEGSDTIGDFLRPLAVLRDEPTPDFPDLPTLNSVLAAYNVSLPSVDYQAISLGMSTKMKEKYPERWAKLVEVNRKLLAREDVVKALKEAQIGYDWRGPEKTQELLDRDTAFLEKYAHLLKRKKD